MAHSTSVNQKTLLGGQNHAPQPPSGIASTLWNRVHTLPHRVTALAIGLGILTWAFWPDLLYLFRTWWDQANYSHGFLVIPIAILIAWQRLSDNPIDWSASRVPWWGWVPLAAILAVRVIAYGATTNGWKPPLWYPP